jgi:hypothetical protein
MQALNLSTDSFDQDNTFTIEIDRRRGPLTITAKLFQDYQKEGDGIYWAMQRSACLKSHYTAKDDEERARLNASTPVRNGDIVLIGGEQYKARVLGDYSNCAVFDPVA